MSGPIKARLLIVDDEEPQRLMLASLLGRAGYEVDAARDGSEALELLHDRGYDLMLTDQRMPKMDGLELLERVRHDHTDLPVVLMTAYGSVSTAVEAMKRGAADYLTKPFERDELLIIVQKVLRQHRLESEVANLRGTLRERYSLNNIIGNSAPMQRVFSLIERVSLTDVPVLVTGETGTGKELVARAIHQNSRRSGGAFVALNCAAVPETLLESEFFGYEKGAFTGADRLHPGKFEQADGGTLFLDEIGAMRIDLQAKLLRALQEKEVQRLGSTRPVPIDVAIVTATSEDLEQAIRDRTFREDLYYRINVVPIHLPPLRERTDDIPLLVDRFLAAAAEKFGRGPVSMAPEVLDLLSWHHWPGNVRELENCIERMVVLAQGERLTMADVPTNLQPGTRASGSSAERFDLPPGGVELGVLEKHLIRQALDRTRGALGPAAKLLGVSYKTLQYRIRKYGFDREEFGGVPGEWAASPPK